MNSNVKLVTMFLTGIILFISLVSIVSAYAQEFGPGDTSNMYQWDSEKIPFDQKYSWYNLHPLPHTITSGTPETGPDGKFDSELMKQGDEFHLVNLPVGEHPYFCMVHPWETSLLIVTEESLNGSHPSGNETAVEVIYTQRISELETENQILKDRVEELQREVTWLHEILDDIIASWKSLVGLTN